MYVRILVFFVVTSLGAWIIMFMGFRTKRESSRYLETETTMTRGTIVDYERKYVRAGRGGAYTCWTPIVEFSAKGQTYRLKYRNYMEKEKFPVGKEVDIYYDMSDPTQFHLLEDPVYTDPGGGAIRIGLIGIVICAVLAVLFEIFVGEKWFPV